MVRKLGVQKRWLHLLQALQKHFSSYVFVFSFKDETCSTQSLLSEWPFREHKSNEDVVITPRKILHLLLASSCFPSCPISLPETQLSGVGAAAWERIHTSSNRFKSLEKVHYISKGEGSRVPEASVSSPEIL